MVRIIISVILCLCAIDGQSQNYKWSISACAGLAIPVGKFATQNLSDQTSAFAKIGESANLSFGYYLNKHYGVSALVRLQRNKVDTKAQESKSLNGVSYPNYNIKINTGSWKSIAFMIGGYYQVSLSERFYLNFELKAGIIKTSVPKTTELNTQFGTFYSNGVIEKDTTYTLITKNKYPLQWTAAYLASGGIKYKLNGKVFILGLIDYSFTEPTVIRQPMEVVTSIATSNGTVIASSGATVPIGRLKYKQPIATINISFGIQCYF